MNLVLGDLNRWRLDPLQAVAPQLRLILRSRIIRNDLRPMSRLSEPELAKHYAVSRQPVREAFITLVNEGLLEIRPQRGTFVKRIDYQSVLDGRFVREAVEADIVRLLAANPDPALIRELRHQIAGQADVARRNFSHFIELDEAFHRTLAHAAGVESAWEYLNAIKSQMDRVRFISNEEFPVARLIKQHETVVDTIERSDRDAAEQAMRAHLREILNALPKIQTLYPDYFEGSPSNPD
ncbi:GntR family transcriptional regulator [Roseobacter sinensis]|uniref:GntR family transcriptional regulator n=1 Tax=Roseobacter sinensis TaxID=2931391 RepID=A0ABT3BAT2_9RHOB|nr:GntR family transcriptional regulator [Roseobacter sp. WL0113]MCV3270688.1 GntR family transcriptional regulator [Roseobacter sp. WL0113]